MASSVCSHVCLPLSGMGLCLCVYIVNIGCGIICGMYAMGVAGIICSPLCTQQIQGMAFCVHGAAVACVCERALL